jgi:hypothetical protein
MRKSKLYTREAAITGEYSPNGDFPAIGNANELPSLWKVADVKLARLSEPVIEWSLLERHDQVERRPTGCLEAFVGLAEEKAGDLDIVKFVKIYGPLSCFPQCLGKRMENEQRYREAVSWYRFYARRVRTVLDAVIEHAGRGQSGQPQALPIEAWKHIGVPYDVGVTWAKERKGPLEAFHNIASQRGAIEWLVTDWLNEAEAQPRLRYTDAGRAMLILDLDRQSREYPCMWKHAFDDLIVPSENTEWTPYASMMYCVLGIQLASYITSPNGVRLCKSCGDPFIARDPWTRLCGDGCRKARRKESQHRTFVKRRARQAEEANNVGRVDT